MKKQYILILILTLLFTINVNASVNPTSSGVNINNNVFNPYTTQYKNFRYKLYNNNNSYNANMATTVNGRLSGLFFDIMDVNLIGQGVYTIEFHTTTTDYTTNLTSAPIMVCLADNFGYLDISHCFTISNKVMGGASSSSGKRSRFQFDFTVNSFESLTSINVNLSVVIGSHVVNMDMLPDLNGTTQYSGVDNFRIDNINMYQKALPGVVVPDDSNLDDLNRTVQEEGAKIIAEQKTTNNWLKNIHDKLFNPNIDDLSSYLDNLNDTIVDDGPISSIISIPLGAYNTILTHLPNTKPSCQPVHMGKALGKDIEFTCINLQTIFNKDKDGNVGTMNLYNTIDYIMCIVSIYFIARQCIHIYEDLTSLKGGKEFD